MQAYESKLSSSQSKDISSNDSLAYVFEVKNIVDILRV